MKNLGFFLIPIFFYSCQQKGIRNDSVHTRDTIVSQKEREENKQIDDTIFMNFKDAKGLYLAEGQLDSIHPRVFIKFKNENLGELNGKIILATDNGNIRFNQIIFPDNSSDGPFGKDLQIQLTQKGNHIIIVGHSQMADNPYWGKFKVQLENSKE
ncbi:hypothetical protein SAMN06265349_10825 [Flavobacterium resistens]|uniref:DUF4251 domain-containing protein n=1 Tax=Flavobacterium resistens TaxID=443612 RepID=A0A521FD38_9FLAO|nr:hypothetical protein [Flavobacterium resistens]MRX67625.1 hypothetical protein [Flavobacterium resistens]SMO93420.1 hypothetical protein SAMN06265349_10825 [Flavobacterium resistens]